MVGAIGLSLAGLSMPENTLCGDVVAIDGEFEGVADVGVVEGRPAHIHDEDVVAVAQ